MIADALSRKTVHSLALITRESRVQAGFKRVNIGVVTEGVVAQMAWLTVQLTLRQRIIESQQENPSLDKILNDVHVREAMLHYDEEFYDTQPLNDINWWWMYECLCMHVT